MPASEPNDFFKEKRSFTEIKQELFGKYFESWCAGCAGKLKDNSISSVLMLDLYAGEEQAEVLLPKNNNTFYLKSIIKRPALNERLQVCMYDKSRSALEQAIETLAAHPNYNELANPPVIPTDAESKTQLAEQLNNGTTSLIFFDPFESVYASQVLLQAVTTGRSDLFMLLRPEKITKAVASKKVSQVIGELFTDQLPDISNYSRKEKSKEKRQKYILDQFVGLLKTKGLVTQLFKINLPDVEQPDHYLLFASQDGGTYRNFKETILPYSTYRQDGVPLFIANEFPQPQLTLFEQKPDYSLPDLVERLTSRAGNYKFKSVDAIYEMDGLDTNYSRENYVAAFEQLRKAGKIELLNPKTMQTIMVVTPASIVKYRL